MRSVEQETINGHTWRVQQYPALKSLQYLRRLLKVVAPSLGSLMAAAKGKKISGLMNQEVNPEFLKSALNELVDRLDDDAINLIHEMMTAGTVWKDDVEISAKNFDLTFMGDFGTLMQVLWFIVKVNYSSFLDAEGIDKMLSESQ